MTFSVTRINVGDHDAWKPMFDQGLIHSRAARGRAAS
jgi:hypothetical protein